MLGEKDIKPFRGLLGLRATGDGCFNIHDFNDLHKYVISIVIYQ